MFQSPKTLIAVLGLMAPSGFGQTTAPAMPLERCSYIGVATSIAPPAVREQLNLPRGVGVMIDDVEPGSPADAAGITAHDVIEKFNDQIIVNVQQFSVLVRLQKPGDVARLRVIHHGKPEDRELVLGEKMLPILDEAPPWLRPRSVPMPRPGDGRITGMVTHSDEQTRITLTFRDNDREVSIHDPAGAVLFEGPLNSPEQWAKLPEELREKVQRIERSSAAHLDVLRGAGSGENRAPTTIPE